MKAWLKYLAIRAKSALTNKPVVEMFGNTYLVYGDTVSRVGGWR